MSSKKAKKVTIKHGKKKYAKVAIQSDESFEDFQAKIFSLTLVPLERQKLICKGKKIVDNDSLQKIKNKSTIMLMGSAEKTSIDKSATASQFIEDMSDAQKQAHQADLPPGLENLGNTCYLNSTLQCLKNIPALNETVKAQSQIAAATGATETMSAQLGQLFTEMERTTDSVIPRDFVNFFRGNFPQFAERSEQGHWRQQDADEALVQILGAIKREMNSASSSAASEAKSNEIDSIFGGEFAVETKCKETEAEPVTESTETFLKLRCFIDAETRHINTGILKDLETEVEKRSDVLERNALFSSVRRISKLPQFLNVQLVRFFWKQKKQDYAKVLRKVVFPNKLDVYEFVDGDLKNEIGLQRKANLLKEDRDREARDRAERERERAKMAEAGGDGGDKGNGDGKGGDTGKGKKSEEKREEKKDEMDVDIDIDSAIKGETGYYDLVGIVCHQGLSPKSGHYIAYAKHPKLGWLKFDDETVSECTEEDIGKLYGGGQWQMGYHVFYQKRAYDDSPKK